MSLEVNPASSYCCIPFIPCNCSLRISRIFNEKLLKTIFIGFGGASIGSLLGVIMATTVPYDTTEERGSILKTGTYAGLFIGGILSSSIYCLSRAKISCLVKVCPKTCFQTINDGQLQTPIAEENL